MSENQKKVLAKRIDTVLFVVMMLGILFCIEYSDNSLSVPVIVLVSAIAIYFAVKGLIGLRNSNPAQENDDDITKINFMHRSRAVGVLIAAIVKAEKATSVEEVDKYSEKVQTCNERINNLWREYLANDDIDLKRACDWLVENLDNRECYVSVEYIFDMAHYLKKITDEAWECLYEMMKRLHISDDDTKYLRHKYAIYYNQEPDDTERGRALRLLGVPSDAKLDDIHAAFSKLVKRYHSEGITDVNLVKYTDVKMQEINTAHIYLTETDVVE